MKKIFFLGLTCLLVQGCSNPFGAGSLIEGISDGISSIFGKTSSSLVAGATQKFQTASSYKGSISVGHAINQNQTTTNGGYTVMTSIKNSN